MLATVRWVVVVFNVLSLSMIGYTFIEQGAPRGDEWLLVGLLTSTPLLTLVWMILDRRTEKKNSTGALGELVGLEIEARKAVLRRRIEG